MKRRRVDGPELAAALDELQDEGHAVLAVARGKGNAQWVIEYEPMAQRQAEFDWRGELASKFCHRGKVTNWSQSEQSKHENAVDYSF